MSAPKKEHRKSDRTRVMISGSRLRDPAVEKYVLRLIGSSLRHSFRTPLSIINNALLAISEDLNAAHLRVRPDTKKQVNYLALEISQLRSDALDYYQLLGSEIKDGVRDVTVNSIGVILRNEVQSRLHEIHRRCLDVENALIPIRSNELHEFTRMLRFEANRMMRTFNGILQLGDISENMMAKPNVNLTGRMRVACDQVRANFGIENDRTKAYNIPNSHLYMEAAEPLLDVLFQNLFENATRYALRSQDFYVRANILETSFHRLQEKYSSDLGRIESTGPWIEAHITNSGPLIAKDQAKNIFNLYYTTEEPTDAATGGGSGVGLALCKLICAVHGGTIFANSSNTKEADFTILLPARQVDAVSVSELLPRLTGL